MRRSPRRRRGATLVLVLWLLVLTGGIAAGVTSATRRALDATAAQAARVQGRYAAESAVAAAAATLTRALEDADSDPTRRAAIFTRLPEVLAARLGDSLMLGAARAQVVMLDLSARLDLNDADTTALIRLLGQGGNSRAAARTVRALRAGAAGDGRIRRPLRSLEEAARVPGVDSALLAQAAGDLTVDGDGQVNVRAASRAVLAAATGSRVQEPTRLLVIARGWATGHPLTHELQAVFALEGTRLTFVRWREEDR